MIDRVYFDRKSFVEPSLQLGIGGIDLARHDADRGAVIDLFQSLEDRPQVRFVFRRIELTAFDVHIRLNAQRLLAVFFIGDTHIDVLDQFVHDVGCRLAVFPQLAAIVEIAGNRNAGFLRRLDRLQ